MRSGRRKPTAPKKRPKAVIEMSGQVSSVTAEATFLDRGTLDGLAAGQRLTFTRAGKTGGSCVVEAVSEHFARCAGSGLRPGDRFPVPRASVTLPRGTALPPDGELSRRALMFETTDWRLLDFDTTGARANRSGPRVELLFSHTTWGNPNSEQGPFAVQRIDAAVYDVELWKGLRASADVTVINFSARPAATRTVYQKSPVLLVRQLELGFRRADVPFSGAIGRTWLRSAIGMLVVDGAQAAWRFGEGLEVGAYGGLLPDAARLSITPSQWTVGAFGRARFSSGSGATATVGQVSARAGWALRDVLGGRAEVAVGASVWKGQVFDANAAVELGFGQTQAPAGIDAARFELGWRPSETVRLNGGVRYRGLPLTGITELGTVSPGQRAIHADLAAVFQLSDGGLLLAVQGGLASDFLSGLSQARLGPELSLPHLLGLPVGVSAGYLEELGWLRGRFGYFQLNVAPMGLFRVLGRASWFHQQASAQNAGSHEVGGSFALEVTPWRYLHARVLVVGRLPLGGERSALGSVGFQLGGAF